MWCIDVDELILCSERLSDISRLSLEDGSGSAVSVETEDGGETVINLRGYCVRHCDVFV
jgi:hypothetical protein